MGRMPFRLSMYLTRGEARLDLERARDQAGDAQPARCAAGADPSVSLRVSAPLERCRCAIGVLWILLQRQRGGGELRFIITEAGGCASTVNASNFAGDEIELTGDRSRDPAWRIPVADRRGALDDAPSVEIVARALGASPRTLQRRLNETGLTFRTLSRLVRVHEAAWELLETDRRITEIAVQCGFSDAAHLTREFRRATGRTPSAFRRLVRGDEGAAVQPVVRGHAEPVVSSVPPPPGRSRAHADYGAASAASAVMAGRSAAVGSR